MEKEREKGQQKGPQTILILNKTAANKWERNYIKEHCYTCVLVPYPRKAISILGRSTPGKRETWVHLLHM